MILNYLKFSIILLPPLLVTSFIPDLVVSLNSLILFLYKKT